MVFGGLAVVFTIVYAVTDGSLATVYLQLLGGIAATLVFPVIGLITKKPFSISLSVLVGCLVFFGIHLGKAANLYEYVPQYDKILHTNFGIVGSAMIYALLLRWNGDKLARIGLILIIFCAVMGMGALWEIVEYICAIATGEDPQVVWPAVDAAIQAGQRCGNPVEDTMWDLIVTAIGSVVFMIFYFIDGHFGGKACKFLFSQPKEEKQN